MPGEPHGPSYTAPPSIVSTVEGERIRSVEDFLARRIKVMTETTSTFTVTSTGWQTVPLGNALYDTSGLYDGVSKFVVPHGGEGDYLLIATIKTDHEDWQEGRISTSAEHGGYAQFIAIPPAGIGLTYQLVATHTMKAGDTASLIVARLVSTHTPEVRIGTRFEMRRLV